MGAVKLSPNDVKIQDQFTEQIDLYLYKTVVSPTLASAAVVGANQISVVSATSLAAGQVITIYEKCCIFQSLITNVAGTTITLASILDTAFTTDAVIDAGIWNMNVNGSVTSQTFKIKAPSLVSFDFYTICVSMTDQTAMDSAKFGGLTALSKGFLFRVTDGTIKNMPVVVNNLGFLEAGFTIRYDDKAPSGYYGFAATKNIRDVNGVSIRLNGTTADELQVIIQDDLTGLDNINVTVHGHRVD